VTPQCRLASPSDPAHFRKVLGRLPTGVVAVCAQHRDGPVGMACNSFTSVSLDPALVSFSVAVSSTTWPLVRECGRLCVNVLAAHHSTVARRFSLRGEDRFEGLGLHPRVGGPGLDDAVAWIDCEIESELDAGDHVIVLARVLALESRPDAEALLFWDGRYGAFTEFRNTTKEDR